MDVTQKHIGIIFPHQLFENNPLIHPCDELILVEEHLFFNHYRFHKKKLAFHRASMKKYEADLIQHGRSVLYIDANNPLSDVRELLSFLKKENVASVTFIDPTDDWLMRRIKAISSLKSIEITILESPLFLNSLLDIELYFKDKKRFHQTDFYVHSRKKTGILMEKTGKPIGEKWTFDTENRLKYPKNQVPPTTFFEKENEFHREANEYIETHFPSNYGELNSHFNYPISSSEARIWLLAFFEKRFYHFGAFEDAIVSSELVLHHSVLTPMLNVGLLTPNEVIDEALKFASENDIPINSLEGFVRQIMGWREFIRSIYHLHGNRERTTNFWNFNRKIPASFWNGTTGIEPIDQTIKKILESGYCHHIERLMVLGNFMLLCEFDPDEVYVWFMTLFIDAYDWVMVPNVYGMSQFADGGIFATKPYISGSNYILKMSDFKSGSWQKTWDGLFWNFMDRHRDFFLKNPRLGMLVRSWDKMSPEKREIHLNEAKSWFEKLDRSIALR